MKPLRSKLYVVLGNPIPLARARFSTHGRFYDAQKHLKFCWGLELNKQHQDAPLFSGPIELDIIFYMPIKKSNSKKNQDGTYHVIAPDLSNMIKFVEDAASNGVLYHDDCIIASVISRKVYDANPRTEFMVRELSREK